MLTVPGSLSVPHAVPEMAPEAGERAEGRDMREEEEEKRREERESGRKGQGSKRGVGLWLRQLRGKRRPWKCQ